MRDLWDEPAVADPPGPMRRDWALVAVIIPAMIAEALIREPLPGRGLSLVFFPLVALALPWRRIHAARIALGLFSVLFVLNLASLTTSLHWEGLGTGVVVLLLPYSLFRWASGRNAGIGLGLMLVMATISMFDQAVSAGEVGGGYLVLLFPTLLGAEIRTLSTVREKRLQEARLTERESLARELHDSVAHHVSAIAVQAQAGQAVAPSDPQAALDALAVIEEEASRTLAEMRTIVGALRDSEKANSVNADNGRAGGAALTPQPGLADLDRLARGTGGLEVDVELHGELAQLRPSVDAALYRLAQESVTNAVRHARNASRVSVRVDGDHEVVRLTVHDDGDPVGGTSGSAGFGLVGMNERATLLGGTVEAGPSPRRGWTVTATLPREVSP